MSRYLSDLCRGVRTFMWGRHRCHVLFEDQSFVYAYCPSKAGGLDVFEKETGRVSLPKTVSLWEKKLEAKMDDKALMDAIRDGRASEYLRGQRETLEALADEQAKIRDSWEEEHGQAKA